jgi:hypoxanthine phosphoribosyltransferase
MFDECELAGLRDWFGTAGRNPSVLIVDDAVDSGATLAYVLQAVRRLAPPSARIRSAAISQTTEQPLACPTYVLYYRRLCRFPWSLDARAVGRS